jgi:hypothetical protein
VDRPHMGCRRTSVRSGDDSVEAVAVNSVGGLDSKGERISRCQSQYAGQNYERPFDLNEFRTPPRGWGYVSNRVAQSLRTQRSNTIGP